MDFISTRTKEKVTPSQAILQGVPERGGLFVPERLPKLSKEELETMLTENYAFRVAKILHMFFDFDEEWLKEVCEKAYGAFEGNDPIPLVRIDENRYILELIHGPSCAYEDFAMTLLPALFQKAKEIEKVKSKLMLVMATSGDAGESAISVFAGKEDFALSLLYPNDYLSKLGRLQICTCRAKNVFAAGTEGTFDDCREIVESLFTGENRKALSGKGYYMTTASSSNIARIIPQIACYFSAYADLVSSDQITLGDEVDIAVPCGNLGNLVAGLYAKEMGLPVGKFLCSVNRNRALLSVFTDGTGEYKDNFRHTMSLNMDVGRPQNFERILFEECDRNEEKTAEYMTRLENRERITLDGETHRKFRRDFYAAYASEDDMVEAVYDVFEEYGYAMDTHTGVAMSVARKYLDEQDEKNVKPLVILAVANPYKFPQDVLYALTGNDVKDSYKGIKRINFLTAMKPPKCLLDVRYLPLRFNKVFKREKLFGEIFDFASGKLVPLGKEE